jgi:hypothetical protein
VKQTDFTLGAIGRGIDRISLHPNESEYLQLLACRRKWDWEIRVFVRTDVLNRRGVERAIFPFSESSTLGIHEQEVWNDMFSVGTCPNEITGVAGLLRVSFNQKRFTYGRAASS